MHLKLKKLKNKHKLRKSKNKGKYILIFRIKLFCSIFKAKTKRRVGVLTQREIVKR